MLNAITDDFGDGYAMVFANAVLLHFTREEMATALAKAYTSLQSGGVLAFSVKMGEGEAWLDDKLGAPRYFCYWQAEPLRKAVEAAGFKVLRLSDAHAGHNKQQWLHVIAKKA